MRSTLNLLNLLLKEGSFVNNTDGKRFSLTGKTAIITGALGFLGQYLCRGFAEAGANVVAVDLDNDKCEKFALALGKNYKIKSLGIACNVCDPVSVRLMKEQSCKKFTSIDILINNAAYKSKDPARLHAPFEKYSLQEWKGMMDVNVNGVFLCSQAIGSVMAEQECGGSIIQMSSIYGIMGTDHRIYEGSNRSGNRTNNPASYSASKGAILSLTKYLATYWSRKGVRVNALSPGGIENAQNTEFINEYSKRVPIGRMAKPTELVGALIFLASDESSYVTGQNIVVDGGLTSW